MYCKKVAVLLFFVGLSVAVQAQEVEEIIEKYIAYTGGEQQWKRISTIVTAGTYNYGGIEFPFKAYSKAPNKYKLIVPFKDKYYAQAFDGKTGWKIDAFKGENRKTLLTGEPARAMANEADVELESALINYKMKGHIATLEGIDTVENKACFKVKLVRKDGAKETYFFDKETFSLLEKEAVAKNAELDRGLLQTYYSDYRKVQGVTIPFVATSKANGQTILVVTISQATINTPVLEMEFKP